MQSVIVDEIEIPVCDCTNWEIRWRKDSAGRIYYCRQCLNCGRMIDQVKKQSLSKPPEHEFDELLREAWTTLCQELRQERYEQKQAQWANESAEWHAERQAEYTEYLNTPHWKSISAQVRNRDHCRCQICGAEAYDVHHLTYEHRGQEYLFELVTLCHDCHIRQYHNGHDGTYYE